MSAKRSNCTEERFIALWRELQSATLVAKALDCSITNVSARRRRIERDRGIVLPVYDPRGVYSTHEVSAGAVATLNIEEGVVVVGSDFHIVPGPLTTMQRAFLMMVKRLKPAAVILNGDVADFSSIGRHPTIGWEKRPTVKSEFEAISDYLGELVKAAGKAQRFWTLGNHDARFESRIANLVPELAGMKGVHLKDHFPLWIPCWRVDINPDQKDMIVRHRELGGEHADHRNVVTSNGWGVCTGHDHRANVTAYHSYGGTKFGVRCGYMGESPRDPQFVHYLEAREPNWHPAFAVLTWRNGVMLWPELCVRHGDGVVTFRGEVIEV